MVSQLQHKLWSQTCNSPLSTLVVKFPKYFTSSEEERMDYFPRTSFHHYNPLYINPKWRAVVNLYWFDIIKYICQNLKPIKPTSNKHAWRARIKSSETMSIDRLTNFIIYSVISLKAYKNNQMLLFINQYDKKCFCKIYIILGL